MKLLGAVGIEDNARTARLGKAHHSLLLGRQGFPRRAWQVFNVVPGVRIPTANAADGGECARHVGRIGRAPMQFAGRLLGF